MKNIYLIVHLTLFILCGSCFTQTASAQTLAAPSAPAPKWIVSDTTQLFKFKNIRAGNGGDEVEWSTNNQFQNPVISSSPATISLNVDAGNAVVIWLRTRNSSTAQVSNPVTTLARVIMTPSATAAGELDTAKKLIHCGSDLLRRSIYETNSTLFKNMVEMDNAIIQKAATPRQAGESFGNNQQYVIPLVFHIINQQGATGISYAQIQSQVNKMNASYAADYAGYNGQTNDSTAVNTNIRFCLAQNPYPANVSWTDSTEPGVMRYYTGDQRALSPPANNLSGCADMTQLTGYPTNFPPDKYCNIWVVPQISGGTGGAEVLGFATFPEEAGNYSSVLDGIVLEAQICGDNSLGGNFNLLSGEDEGKVAVHEAGHYFSAYHPFEPNGEGGVNSTCVPQSGCDGNGDYCCDTKPCLMEFGSCDLTNSCTGANDYPVANFMNYLDPYCVSAFTADQLNNRFMPALTLSSSNRYNLWQPANLTLTGSSCGPCILSAAIYPQFTGNCPGVGSPVQFNTLLGNLYCAKTWSWSFPGGSPSSSALSTANITYNTAGTYTAYLTAGDSSGNFVSDSVTIQVSSATIVANITPLATTVCSGSSQEIQISITNGGTAPYRVVLSNGDIIDSLMFRYGTWQLQDLTASETITITSVNNNVCASTYTGGADIKVIQCCQQNLVRNGNFATGTTGFTSELVWDSTDIGQDPGLFNIYNITTGFPGWQKFPSLQSLGNGMFIDGNYSPNHPSAHPPYSIYWNEDSIPVDSCTEYRFSYNVTDATCFFPNEENGDLDSVVYVILQFDILNNTGTVVYNAIDSLPLMTDSVPYGYDVRTLYDTSNWYWNQFIHNWSSGNNSGYYSLQIRQIINFNGQGCDFGLDNFTFSKVANNCLTLAGNNQSICAGQCTSLGSNIPAHSTVQWTPALGLSDSGVVHPQACPFVTTAYLATVAIDSGAYCGTSMVWDTVIVDAPIAHAGNPYYTVCQLPVTIGSDTAGTGGVQPYIYSWSAPVGGLTHADSSLDSPNARSSGVYTLMVTDSLGCSSIDFANVQLHEILTATDSVAGPCRGVCTGIIHLTISSPGDYGPYVFNWSNGDTSQNLFQICSGTYTVTVSDITNCSVSLSNTINTAAGSMYDTLITQTICPGSAFMGHSASGTYYDTLQAQGGCDSIVTLSLTVQPADTPSITGPTTGICDGDSAILCGPPGFLTYAWNIGDTSVCVVVSQAGDYYVTLTNTNDCTYNSKHFGLTVYQPPTVSISVQGDTLMALNAISYQWYLNNTPLSGDTENICIARQSGTYTVMVTDMNGCSAVSTGQVIKVNSIDVVQYGTGIKLYPNPNNGNFVIAFTDNAEREIEITDIIGNVILATENVTRQKNFDLSYLAAGVYFLRIREGNQEQSLKFNIIR